MQQISVVLTQDDHWNISVEKEVSFRNTICTFSRTLQP